MKKRVNPFLAILIVAAAIGGAWVVWNRMPLGPTAPETKKGDSRPPPGTRVPKDRGPAGSQSGTKPPAAPADKKADTDSKS